MDFPGAALAEQQHRAVTNSHARRVQRQYRLVARNQREDRELQEFQRRSWGRASMAGDATISALRMAGATTE